MVLTGHPLASSPGSCQQQDEQGQGDLHVQPEALPAPAPLILPRSACPGVCFIPTPARLSMTAPRGKTRLDLSIKGKWRGEIPPGSPLGHLDTKESVGEAGAAGAGALLWVGLWSPANSKQGDAYTCEFLCKNHPWLLALSHLRALGWVPRCFVPGCSSVTYCWLLILVALLLSQPLCHVSWWHPGVLGCLRHPRDPPLMEFGLLIRMGGEQHRKPPPPGRVFPLVLPQTLVGLVWPLHPWTLRQTWLELQLLLAPL